MQDTPPEFADLPARSPPWDGRILLLFQELKNRYVHASTALSLEDSEPLRLQVLSQGLMHDGLDNMVSLLQAGLPQDWVDTGAHNICVVASMLEVRADKAFEAEKSSVAEIQPMIIEHTGCRGRPKKTVDVNFLTDAFGPTRNIKLQQVADALGLHRNTLGKQLKKYTLSRKFNPLSNVSLDELVRKFRDQHPHSGLKYLQGFLRKEAGRIQRRRVIEAQQRIDNAGRSYRKANTIKRRTYTSPRPNAVWHMDGHHKLIKWGIVVHGMIDGYCRTITAMKAHTNNRGSTVLQLFHQARLQHGQPRRMRGDRGGENLLTAVWMIHHMGRNRGSFLWGSSNRNSRVERIWLELGVYVARYWRAFFERLEHMHYLNPSDPHHIWLVHYLFLDEINEDIIQFIADWNLHGIQGTSTHNQSPQDLRFLGQLTHGVYQNNIEDHADISSEDLEATYSIDPTHEPTSHDNEGDLDLDDMSLCDIHTLDQPGTEVAHELLHNIRHPPVRVTRHSNPFEENIDVFRAFEERFQDLKELGSLPKGMGVRAEEWNGEGYPEVESLSTGPRKKKLDIMLPTAVWYPRAVRWTQALFVMTSMLL